MKWKVNKVIHKPGELRIQELFLLFPLTINDERRWWEKAKWEECICRIYTIGNSPKLHYSWTPTRWID